jgi:hypothetical protein
MFQELRVHLTLWYCGVLCAALILFGVALYLGAQYFLLSPIEADAAGHAHMRVNDWLTFSSDHACSPFGPPGDIGHHPPPLSSSQHFPMPELTICFDQNGSLLPNEDATELPSAFITNTLANTALQTGRTATDIVNGGSTIGSIYRYAMVVPNIQRRGSMGVVVIGESIQAQQTALSLLLMLLLTVGTCATGLG